MINFFFYLALYLSILIKNHINYEIIKEKRKSSSKNKNISINTSNAEKNELLYFNNIGENLMSNGIYYDFYHNKNNEFKKEENIYLILKSRLIMNLFIVINFLNIGLNLLYGPIFIFNLVEIFFTIILITYYINKINKQTKTGTEFVNLNKIWKLDLILKFCIFLFFYCYREFISYCR